MARPMLFLLTCETAQGLVSKLPLAGSRTSGQKLLPQTFRSHELKRQMRSTPGALGRVRDEESWSRKRAQQLLSPNFHTAQ